MALTEEESTRLERINIERGREGKGPLGARRYEALIRRNQAEKARAMSGRPSDRPVRPASPSLSETVRTAAGSIRDKVAERIRDFSGLPEGVSLDGQAEVPPPMDEKAIREEEVRKAKEQREASARRAAMDPADQEAVESPDPDKRSVSAMVRIVNVAAKLLGQPLSGAEEEIWEITSDSVHRWIGWERLPAPLLLVGSLALTVFNRTIFKGPAKVAP